MLYRVEGIVVRSMDYGEGNKIIVLLAKETGKVSIMARGAKKLKSRLGAVAQMFVHGDYTYYKGGGSQMGTLNAGDIIASHQALREDLHKSAYAAYLAEMTDRMLGDQEGGGHLFAQLSAGLQAVEAGKDPEIIAHIYEMIMLREAGYAPSLSACVSCGNEPDAPLFSIAAGGCLCSRCKAADSERLDLRTFRLLQLIRNADLRQIGSVSVSQPTKRQLGDVMRRYMDHHTGVQWKARNFIEQMDKYEL